MMHSLIYQDAIIEGRAQGLAESRTEGRIPEHISIRREDGMSDEEIISNLMTRFKITREEAEAAIKTHDDELFERVCDIAKYNKIYEDIMKLTQEDTLQLVLKAPNEGEKEFYEMVSDYLIQKKQADCIARNVY